MNDPRLRIRTRDERGLIFARDMEPLQFTQYGSRHNGPDPLWQKSRSLDAPIPSSSGQSQQAIKLETSSPTNDQSQLGVNIEGIPFANVTPGDPTLAVGPNHIIEMVNGQSGSAYFRIYQKDGQPLMDRAFMDQLPGASYNGAGDCITWYDQLADRFVMTEFGDSSATGTNVNSLIMAVSATSDPLGSWYVYEFSDASFFPDYPKFGNWHDAWYGMSRDFQGSYLGNSVWAFNKARMLAGDSLVEVQRFRFSDPDNKYNSMCPVSLAGNTAAPAGTPGFFLYYNDDNFTASATDSDSLGIVSLKVDFANPANSVAKIEQSMPVAPFRSIVCGTRNCAPSPSGNGYDVIASRIMNKPYYRNFGAFQSIVANHTVDATGNAVSGVRWYEIRNSGSGWSVFQQGTFAPQEDFSCSTTPPMHRFMGTITQNALGQIALAYNSSSTQRFASISFTGRNSSDPLNLMSYTENDAFLGTAYGTFGNRWGDYNEIVPDATNDSVFWFCGMYGGSSNGWRTRIISFKLAPNPMLDAALTRIEYPNTCESFCSQVIQPRVRIRNNGTQTLTSAKLNLQFNNEPVITINWTGNLPISQETIFIFPSTTLPFGNSVITAFISEPNGSTDLNPGNDTSRSNISISAPAPVPLTEGFETTSFPPTGWSQISSGSANFRWTRSTAASKSGAASAKFDNFNNNEPGDFADLRSPLLDVSNSDSVSLRFYMAAALFDPVTSDTLEILVSNDCGSSFTRVWRKWGIALATRPGANNGEYIPTANEWREEIVDLSAYAGQEKIIVAFRNINNFGNNIYLDDIGFVKSSFRNLDASAIRIIAPLPVTCNPSVEPEIQFVNLGKDTLRNVRLEYQLDNGTILGTNWSGALGRLQGSSAKLPASLSSTGNRLLKVFISSVNGLADQDPSNDSIYLPIGIKSVMPLPLKEGFEESSFPPNQWNTINPDLGNTWISTRAAARTGIGSLLINNFNSTKKNEPDEIVSPLVSYRNVDSVYLHFQLAAATRSYPGSAEIPLDTLEVMVSTDCGNTYTSVYKKWGAELQTLNSANAPNPVEFTPRTGNQWRKEEINLTGLLGSSNEFLVKFRNTGNGENNIFIDDVEIFTRVLPQRLKNNGFLASPNPFRNQFQLQFFPDASKLTGVEIVNTAGQRVFLKTFKAGSAASTLPVDLSRYPAGTYSVRITFTDRVETTQVVKF